jgi:hypothetical protein
VELIARGRRSIDCKKTRKEDFMKSDQWMKLWGQTVTTFDLTDHFRQTDQLFEQGLDLWTSLQAFTRSWASPQKWIDASVGIADTYESILKAWAGLVLPQGGSDLRNALTDMEKARNLAESTLKEQRQELSRLKSLVTQKDKALNRQKLTAAQKHTDLSEKKKQIKNLEKTIDMQNAQLHLLEEQLKNTQLPPRPTHRHTNEAIPPGDHPKADN